jgi:hypothetical protein
VVRAKTTDSWRFPVADALEVSHVHVGRESSDRAAEWG